MKRVNALALIGIFMIFVGGSALAGCSKPPDEKPATPAPQADTTKRSPSKGSLTDSAGP